MRRLVFTNVIKPTHICNLACTYCYNDDLREPIMREGTLLRTIEQTFSYVRSKGNSLGEIHFIWHGGEPMAVGMDFYQRVIGMQESLAQGVKYMNAIQTNGVLLNDRWIDFFLRNRFSVGVSVDGPAVVHDKYRVTHQGKGSLEKVMRKIELARSSGLEVGVCMVLGKHSLDHVDEIWDFFVECKAPLDVIPMSRSGGARDTYEELGLEPEEYALAWKQLYGRWIDLPKERYFPVQDFVDRTKAVIYGVPTSCHSAANCSLNNISTDPVGDVYPCSSLSGTDAMKYGNVCEQSLDEILASATAAELRNTRVDPDCATCKWQHTCHGGCTARRYKFHGNVHQRDYYCPSLYAMYDYIELKLRERDVAPGVRHPFHMTEGLDPDAIAELQVSVKGNGMAKTIPLVVLS